MRRTRSNRKHRGGGYATTNSLMPFNPADDTQFAVKSPVYQQYSDCYAQSRPGAIANPAAPELAQTGMAGGRRTRRNGGGCGCAMRGGVCGMRGGVCGMRGGGSCGMRGGGSCAMRGGGCGMRGGGGCGMRGGVCGMRGGGSCGMRGGVRKTRRTRQRGGANNGFAVQPNMSVGGEGPIAAPVYAGVPCDARAGLHTPSVVNPDIRAPADLYSLTPNMPAQKGAGLANEECSRAPNSMIPVYPAESAGFHFRPSTEAGSTLPDGVTAYNEVVPHAARLGGARRSTRRRRR